MLIRSVSVHEDSLRLDYCRLDSADACYRFYAAATLPITGEVTESNTFTGQVYAVDSPTNFAAKIRSGQIMLYVYTTQEGKADVLAFLEAAAGGANKKRKIYYCRTMNSNVEVIGDMEPETALVFSAKAEGGYQPYVWEYAIYKGDTLYYTLSGSTFDYLEWSPTETGNYTIVVCVIDKTGFKATYSKQFSIIWNQSQEVALATSL